METAVVIMYVEYEYLLCSSVQVRQETSHLSSGRGREFNKHGRSAVSISPESEMDPDLNPSHRKFVSAKASVKIQIKLISVTEILKNINSVVSNCLSNRHSLCSSMLLIVNAALSC